jgi:hypothetical protein
MREQHAESVNLTHTAEHSSHHSLEKAAKISLAQLMLKITS